MPDHAQHPEQNDAQRLDTLLGQAVHAFQEYADAAEPMVETLQRALNALRQALMPALRIAYDNAGRPYGPGDAAVLRWAGERARTLEQRRKDGQRLNEIVAFSARYAADAAERERMPEDDIAQYTGELAISNPANRRN